MLALIRHSAYYVGAQQAQVGCSDEAYASARYAYDMFTQPLTVNGVKLAIQWGVGRTYSAVYASPAIRAIQTAAAAVGVEETSVIVDPHLFYTPGCGAREKAMKALFMRQGYNPPSAWYLDQNQDDVREFMAAVDDLTMLVIQLSVRDEQILAVSHSVFLGAVCAKLTNAPKDCLNKTFGVCEGFLADNGVFKGYV
ncbi:MAG: histidine phosphatase family protein [Candidatus Magasanikbacteria bacterium]